MYLFFSLAQKESKRETAERQGWSTEGIERGLTTKTPTKPQGDTLESAQAWLAQ